MSDDRTVTEAERVAFTLRKLDHWIDNLRANGADVRAGDLAAIRQYLDGTEDRYIAHIQSLNGAAS